MLDNRRLVNQFASLERRTSSSGKDRIDHGVNGSDDASNAVAMALVTEARQLMVISPEMLARFSRPAPRMAARRGLY